VLGVTRVIWLGGAATAVAFVAGCGSTQAEPRSGHPGTVHVRQEWVGTGLYVEGSYSYVRLERDGSPAVEVKLGNDLTPTATISVEPGSYRLVSYQRPCDGNCSMLDPPTDQCSLPIEVGENEELHELVELTPGAGCTIKQAQRAD
jgi:hypothetical protein